MAGNGGESARRAARRRTSPVWSGRTHLSCPTTSCPSETIMLLMLDNYDSFTYNLVQYFGELGVDVVVHRNDQITLEDIDALNPDHLCISPGPGRPETAGITLDVIRHFAGKTPPARQTMHGKTSDIRHDGTGVFAGLPSPLTVTRYHSLAVDAQSLPDCLAVTAQADDGEIMALRHREHVIHGVQFHPESLF